MATALFASGHAADFVLLVMAVEAIALVRLGPLRPGAILAATLPGALIVGALRAALVGAAWPWIALPLLLSWPVHLWDIRSRARAADRRRVYPIPPRGP